MDMSKLLVSAEFWAAATPLLAREPPKRRSGGLWCDDRVAFAGIVSAPCQDVVRKMPPLGSSCSFTICSRRLPEWQGTGVRTQQHLVLLDRRADCQQLDRSRSNLDSGPCRRRAARVEAPPRSAEWRHPPTRFNRQVRCPARRCLLVSGMTLTCGLSAHGLAFHPRTNGRQGGHWRCRKERTGILMLRIGKDRIARTALHDLAA